MNYWEFHLTFILPAIGALLVLCRGVGGLGPPRKGLGIGLMAGTAFLYTAPWDHYLIARGVWSYQPNRVSMSLRLGNIPLEECCFFVLQPVLTGLCLLCFLRQRWDWRRLGTRDRDWLPRVVGGTLALLSGLAGAYALTAGERWLYFGLLLLWSAPPLALHWFYGGDALWALRHILGPSLILSTVYLWAADRAAIGAQIWVVSPSYSSRWSLLGLPVEEAVFFLVTNLLILQGLLLFFRWVAIHRAAE